MTLSDSHSPEGRIVCHFSCGAASAVATKLALAEFGPRRVVIFNAFVVEEDPDNRRFLADCEKWFAHPVKVLRDEKYGASAREVWRRKRFMNSLLGAPCSQALKRDVIEAECLPTDQHVYGFTVDEMQKDRVKRFLAVGGLCPLIDRNLSHADCLGMVERAGILLPLRYRQGYNNANCVGCCKGGEGYWNKTRRDSPSDFIAVAEIQKDIGPGAYFFRDRGTGERFSLYDLPPDAGRHSEESPDCSFFCDMAEQEIKQSEDAEPRL
jgi:hypothetical protein